MAQDGIYRLQSCPAGYELVASAGDCLVCPTYSYCLGGSNARSQCPKGYFSVPGSNSSLGCTQVVFVYTALTFPTVVSKFSAQLELALRRLIANGAGVDVGRVLVASISESETDASSSLVIIKLAFPDAALAASLRDVMRTFLGSSLRLYTAIGLPEGYLNSVTVSACIAGYELILGTSSFNVGSDGHCERCPASYYCLGGIAGRLPCPTGYFAPAGANSSGSCTPAVFVLVTVTLAIPAENFTSTLQSSYVLALATASDVSIDMISLIKISSTEGARRSSSKAVRVQSSVATSDATAAIAISDRLDAKQLNTQLAAQGLPPAELESVSILASDQHSGTPQWALISWLVGCLVLLLLGLTAALYIWHRKKGVSDEDRALHHKIAEIRKLLRLCKSDGYFMGSERPGYWEARRGAAIHLRQSQLEAAARLALSQDFDLLQFNAFCIVLEGGLDEDATKRYGDLTNWLLDMAATLICPSSPGEEVSPPPGKTAGSTTGVLSGAERFRLFEQKVIKARIWTDDPSLFLQLQRRAQRFMDDIALECDVRYQCMCGLPHGGELVAFQSPVENPPKEEGGSAAGTAQTEGAGPAPATTSSLILRQDHPEVLCFVPLSVYCSVCRS